MSIEIEAKYRLLCGFEEVFESISSIGDFIEECLEIDTYYDHPCRSFRESDEALRLRTRLCSGEHSFFLTYKGPRLLHGSVKERLEIELGILDRKAMENILLKLGFKQVLTYVKKRYSFKYRSSTIHLDKLYGIGLFMEVEGCIEDIREVVMKLDKCLEPVDKTYLEICLETGNCVSSIEDIK